MVHHDAPGFQQRMNLAEVGAKISEPDVLEHADGCDPVKTFVGLDITVILQADLNLVTEPRLLDPFTGELELVA